MPGGADGDLDALPPETVQQRADRLQRTVQDVRAGRYAQRGRRVSHIGAGAMTMEWAPFEIFR